MDTHLKLQTSLRQRPVFTLALKQSLEILQMPQIELAPFLREEIEKNPLLLEKHSPSASFSHPLEETIAAKDSLYEHLLKQIEEKAFSKKEKEIALKLLENLDEKGFMSTSLEEIGASLNLSLSTIEPVLAILQSFDPSGIFAKDVKEALLIQLKELKEENSPSFFLVRDSFDELLQGKYKAIEAKLGKVQLQRALQKLSKLSLRPSKGFQNDLPTSIICDLKIFKEEEKWIVEVGEEDLPKIEIQSEYSQITPMNPHEKDLLKEWLLSAKWLLRSLKRRKEILLTIGMFLAKKQTSFFEQKGNLIPFSLQEASSLLGLHESTLSRALQGKYISTPLGIFPIKSLFLSSPKTKSTQEALLELIAKEDRQNPFSDDALAKILKEKGHCVARRTISKYRKLLKIAPKARRKHHQRPRACRQFF